MSADLTVRHDIPAPLEVVSPELGLKAQNLVTAAKVLEVVDAATFETANRILVEIHAAGKALEARRVELKKPITALGKAIDSVVANVADPLDVAKRALSHRVVAYQRAEQEKAEKAKREAEEKAAAERAAAEAERARLQAEADAKAKQEAEDMARILGAPVEPEKVTVEAPKPAPAPAPPITAAPVKATAIQTRKVKKLVIDDEAAVPAYVAGINIRPIDNAAVRKLVEAGVTVPGCRMVEVEEIGMARGRA